MGPEPWKPVFLKALREELSVTNAVALAGIAWSTAYLHRKKDPEFGAAWDECWTQNVDDLEASAFKRAKDGWLEPVYQNGQLVGEKRCYDNRLTWNFLQKWRPERYADEAKGNETIEALALLVAQQVQGARFATGGVGAAPDFKNGSNGTANGYGANGHG